MRKISLRWRLTLVTVVVLVIISAASTVFSIFSAGAMFEPVSDELELIGVRAQTIYELSDTLAVASLTAIPSEEYQSAADGEISVWSVDFIDTYPTIQGRITSYDDYVTVVATAASEGVALTNMTAAASLTMATVQQGFNYSSLVFMAIMVLLGGILVYFSSGIALRPVKALSTDIKAIGGEQLSHRLETKSNVEEIGLLSESFNAMLERLETAFEAQKRFSTAAAHELKTPLAAIRTNLDVLNMDDEPSVEDYAETMSVVRRQTERMSRLVDDLFTMSSLQEWEMEDGIRLDSLLYSAAEDVAAQAEQNNITVSVTAGDGVISGNAVMLSRAVANLTENAVRYGGEGSEIKLFSECREDSVVITVSDSGSGIDETDLPNIFDPFYRADPSRSRSLGGAGLGLSITKEIIELHGGTLIAENKAEGGAIFTITLPLQSSGRAT